jgi:hypothetical protein
MSTQGSRSRYKQLLERKRQVRRRTLLRRLAALLLLCIVIGLIAGVVAGIRGCALRRNVARTAESSTARVSKPDSDIARVQLVFSHDFRPGPEFVALDDQRLYVASVSPGKDDAPDTTLLAAFGFKADDPLWQLPLEVTFAHLLVAGGNVVGVPTAGDSLQRFDGASGKHLAGIDTDPANAAIGMDSRVVLAGYTEETGAGRPALRIAAYNAKSGQFAWSRRSKLPGLAPGMDACCGAGRSAELTCWEGLCAYQLHNVVGLLQTTGKGQLVRPEYAASGHIAAVQLDVKGRMAYIIAADKADATLYRLIRIPIDRDFPAKRMLEFHSASGEFMLYGEQGQVLLGYTGQDGAGQLVCFRKDEQQPALKVEADAGVADISAVPGAAGEFIVATSTKFTDGEPVGAGKVYRVRLALGGTAEAFEIGQYKQPVTWVVPFKRDCLVLVRGGGLLAGGGQVIRYSADSGKLKLLRRARYPLLDPLHSADRTALLVSSYTEDYALEKGGPLQALVFK